LTKDHQSAEGESEAVPTGFDESPEKWDRKVNLFVNIGLSRRFSPIILSDRPSVGPCAECGIARDDGCEVDLWI